MKTVSTLIMATLVLLSIFSGVAWAAWPSGAQGDQYAAVNTAMESATAAAGISTDTFIHIYNDALAGNLGGYTSSQLAAACQVMRDLSDYKGALGNDYDKVYRELGCSTRFVEASASQSSLPGTEIAILLIVGSGLVGILAAMRMLRKNR